jgi:hypothetical protein
VILPQGMVGVQLKLLSPTPSEQGHMVDLDASLSQELLEIPVGQSVRRYQRTAIRMTSGGNLNPVNADFGGWMGRIRWRCFTSTASSIGGPARAPEASGRGRAQRNSAELTQSYLPLAKARLAMNRGWSDSIPR